MSNKVSVLVYSRKIGSPVRKAVLVYFAERASDNGEGIWASKSTIADAIECGRSTVIRTINDFVAEGILRHVGTRPCQNGETVEYAMILDAIDRLPPVKEDARALRTSPGAGLVAERDGSHGGTPPVPERDPYPSRSGTQTTIKTTIEPPEEPLVVPQPKKPKRRASSISEDWEPSERNVEDAFKKQFTPQEIRDEAQRFRDYHLAKGTTFADWDAGWRTWIGNARKFGASRSSGRQQSPAGQQLSGLAGAAMRRRDARQQGYEG